MNSEDYAKMVHALRENAARSYDRELLSACTYAVDPGREEPKTATAVLAQMESVQEQMRRYQAEDMRRLVMADPYAFRPPSPVDGAVFKWEPRRPKKELTFTALQDTVLPDLYGRKQHAQLLAAQRKRESDAAARLRDDTNRKIGGLLRGFLGVQREED